MLRDLLGDGQKADLVVQQRLLQSNEETIPLARNLAQRSAALRTVDPKVRAKGSDAIPV